MQDFPRHTHAAGAKPPKRTKAAKDFERSLFGHALELGMPRDYLDGVLSKQFDFRSVRVSLIASTPGMQRPDLDDDSDDVALGLLRIKQLVGEEKSVAAMEICSASVGKLDRNHGAWLRHVWHAVSGGKIDWEPQTGNQGQGGPPMQIVYPTVKDIGFVASASAALTAQTPTRPPACSSCQRARRARWVREPSRRAR